MAVFVFLLVLSFVREGYHSSGITMIVHVYTYHGRIGSRAVHRPIVIVLCHTRGESTLRHRYVHVLVAYLITAKLIPFPGYVGMCVD